MYEPYGSAADIPSIADMLQKIEGGKFLTRFIAREIEGAMRWIRHDEDGMAAAPNEPGRWGLMSWTRWGMIQDRGQR